MAGPIKQMRALVPKLASVPVLVLGDYMIDIYCTGTVPRLSPEAPVPVCLNPERRCKPGGAGNVVSNIAALGADVVALGVTGKDREAADLEGLLCEASMTAILVEDPTRRTTVKMRYVDPSSHHLLRVDFEDDHEISDDLAQELLDQARLCVDDYGIRAVVLSDYDKGTLTPSLIDGMVELCSEREVPIIADPKRRHFWHFKHVTVLKPNSIHLLAQLGMSDGEQAVVRAASEAMERLQPGALLVTMGAQGMAVIDNGGVYRRIRGRAVQVSELTGAGDTVTALLGLALGAGADVFVAAQLANVAASLVVAKAGTATVSKEELMAELRE